jgi:hypothetical protein
MLTFTRIGIRIRLSIYGSRPGNSAFWQGNCENLAKAFAFDLQRTMNIRTKSYRVV